MSELGTKGKFRGWMLLAHRMTYTAYTKLTPEAKASMHAEYKKVRGSHEAVDTRRE